MVSINECVIARDAKYLYLKAAIDDFTYFDNVFIDYIEVTANSVKDSAIDTVTVTLNTDGTIRTDSHKVTTNVKSIDLTLTPQDLGLSNFSTAFLVIKVFTKGTPSIDTPCGMDEEYAVGIAYNENVIYNIGLQYIRQVGIDCEIPQDFIDWIMRTSAFELALKSGNLDEALNWWVRLNNKVIQVGKKSNCGCHG